MKHKVESKYKNPDRYIRWLKSRLQATERSRQFWEDRSGNWVVEYTDDDEKRMGLLAQDFGVFEPEDIVIIKGRIIKVEQDLTGSFITFDKIQFRRRRDHE